MSNSNGPINLPLLLIILGGLVLAALIVLLVLFLIKRRNATKEDKKEVEIDNEKWVNALGGRGNISNIETKGSRLVVYLINNDAINKEELHELGVTSVISSKDKITLVLNQKAENVGNLLK